MINPSDASFFPALQQLLSWTSKRQQALAGNVANMDTPGYQAHDYSFEQELATMNLATTGSNHIAPLEDVAHARLYEGKTKLKANGKNVDLQRQMDGITKKRLHFN